MIEEQEGQIDTRSAVETEVKALLFRKFFARLDEQAVPYAILSNYFAYPEDIHSDIDFVVPEDYRRSIPSLVQAVCRENGAHLLQISEYHNTSAFSCFVATIRNFTPIHLRFDVCSDDHRRDKLILPWQFMLQGRRRYLNSFFVPAPEKSALHYLLKRIEKRSIETLQLRALHRWHQAAPRETEAMVRRYWPSDYEQILECIVAQRAPQAESLAAWAKNVQLCDARQSPLARVRQYLRELGRRWRRFIRPIGYLVSFVGPDGCGKTTAIAGVMQGVHPAFARKAEFHLLPRAFYRGRKDTDTSRPHAKRPRSRLASMAKIFLWFLDLSVGYWIKLRPMLVRSTVILFDRYIHDVQIDRTRYRYSGPKWWPRLLGRLSPQPDLWILLDASAEVLWRRKAELTKEEGARQAEAYRRLIANKCNAHLVDASQSPEAVVAAVCSEIFTRLEARTSERYRLILTGFGQ